MLEATTEGHQTSSRMTKKPKSNRGSVRGRKFRYDTTTPLPIHFLGSQESNLGHRRDRTNNEVTARLKALLGLMKKQIYKRKRTLFGPVVPSSLSVVRSSAVTITQ